MCLITKTAFYCSFPLTGLGNVVPDGPCAPGYYCAGGQVTDTPPEYICPPGSYCPEGSPIHTVCDNGTYNHQEGQDSCLICPEGRFCDPFHENGEHKFIYFIVHHILNFLKY